MADRYSTGAFCAGGDVSRVALFDVPAAALARDLAGGLEQRPAVHPQSTIWIVDGSGSLYAVPTRDEQLDVVERVAKRGSACRGCRLLEHSGGNGWDEPSFHACRWPFAGQTAAACAGYVDELPSWEQNQLDQMSQTHFEALTREACHG